MPLCSRNSRENGLLPSVLYKQKPVFFFSYITKSWSMASNPSNYKEKNTNIGIQILISVPIFMAFNRHLRLQLYGTKSSVIWLWGRALGVSGWYCPCGKRIGLNRVSKYQPLPGRLKKYLKSINEVILSCSCKRAVVPIWKRQTTNWK